MMDINFNYDPKDVVSLPIAEAKCFHCGMISRHPIEYNDLDPMSVMQCREENRYLRWQLSQCGKDFNELSQECLDAGVKPASMKRFEDTLKLLRDLTEKFNEEKK